MSSDIYAPPKADVRTGGPGDDRFYVVGSRKFYLLFILSFGLYTIYWFYKNYSLIKLRTQEDIWPVPRGIFSIFFAHNLFRRIDNELNDTDSKFTWTPNSSATLYILVVLGQSVSSNLGDKNIGSPITDLLTFALLPLIAVVVHPAQKAINTLCGDPTGAVNSRLTAFNWVWVIIGGLVWLLVLAALAVIVFSPELLLE